MLDRQIQVHKEISLNLIKVLKMFSALKKNLQTTVLFLIFWIKQKFRKYQKEMVFETMAFHGTNETAF